MAWLHPRASNMDLGGTAALSGTRQRMGVVASEHRQIWPREKRRRCLGHANGVAAYQPRVPPWENMIFRWRALKGRSMVNAAYHNQGSEARDPAPLQGANPETNKNPGWYPGLICPHAFGVSGSLRRALLATRPSPHTSPSNSI